MHAVAQHRARLRCPLWPPGSLGPSAGSRRGRAMGAGRECPRRAYGQGVKAPAELLQGWKWEHPAATLPSPAAPVAPVPAPKKSRSHLQQSSLMQEELSLPPLKKIHTDQPRKRSWGLSGAGAGYVPRVSPQQRARSPLGLSQRGGSLWPQSCALPGCTHSGTVKPLSRSLVTGSPNGTLSPGTDADTTSLASAPGSAGVPATKVILLDRNWEGV